MNKNKLTPKQERFVQEYVKDLNATQAAIRAGYSEKTANRIGPENLSKPVIAEAVAAYQAVIADKTGLDARFVLEGLMREATSYDEDATSTSRVSALSWLGKHLKLFTDKAELEVKGLPRYSMVLVEKE